MSILVELVKEYGIFSPLLYRLSYRALVCPAKLVPLVVEKQPHNLAKWLARLSLGL